MRKELLHQRGYTIAEILAVISILVIIGSLVSGILYSVLRGTSKSKITTAIAQNGNYSLSVISNLITDADRLEYVIDNTGTKLLSCSPGPVVGKSLAIRGLDGGISIIACEDSDVFSSKTISSQSASFKVSLIDTSFIAVVKDSCSLSCSQQDVFSAPRIDIAFDLSDKEGGGFSEKKGSATFKTSILMRNYNQR